MNRRNFLTALAPGIAALGGVAVVSSREEPKLPQKIELSDGKGGRGVVELVSWGNDKLAINIGSWQEYSSSVTIPSDSSFVIGPTWNTKNC